MNSRHWRTAPVFTSLITASLIAGWSIPAFYDWTDSDQSRPSPLLWKVPLSAALVSLAFCLALPWLPNLNDEPTEKSDPRMRFGIRSLLLATSAVAGTLTLLTKFPVTASVLVFTGTAVHFSVFIWRHPPNRFAASALIACMFLPFAWVIGYDELERILPSLAWMFAGMPAIVPAIMIGSMLEQNLREAQWLAFLLTAIELAIGVWMIQLGPKRTIAYLIFVAFLSWIGSMGFYQLCIA